MKLNNLISSGSSVQAPKALNQKQLEYITGGELHVLGSVIVINNPKKPGAIIIYFNQTISTITYYKVFDTRVNKAIINTFIISVFSEDHSDLVAGHTFVLYVPRVIGISNSYVDSLRRLLNINIKILAWKKYLLPQALTDIHLLLNPDTLFDDIEICLKSINTLISTKIRNLALESTPGKIDSSAQNNNAPQVNTPQIEDTPANRGDSPSR